MSQTLSALERMDTAAPGTGPPNEALLWHVKQIHSDDGSVIVNISSYGGQVMDGRIGGRPVILPLDRLHSISRDTREIDPNSDVVGETTSPGGTWLSFGGGQIEDHEGAVIREAPVHGIFSAPSNRHAIGHLASNSIVMRSAPKDTEAFFRPGETYAVGRQVMAVNRDAHNEGSIQITNIITYTGEESVVMPEAAEHSYFESGAAAAILNAKGEATLIAKDAHAPAKANGNDIDTRFDSTLTGTPGRCVFLPEGEGGHAVVIDAKTTGPDGSTIAIDTFCLYRYRQADQWTAIEPVISGNPLRQGQSVAMTVSIQTFDSLNSYMQTQSKP